MVADVEHAVWILEDGGGANGPASALFPWWSLTKTAIAACALMLEEREVLDLETAVDGITLAQLLSHRAGLGCYGPLPAYKTAVAAGSPPWSRAEVLARVEAGGRQFAPGQGWSYSNLGYMLARERIEAAAGRALAALVADLIAGPLGLTSVRLAETRSEFAAVHWPDAAAYDPGWVYPGCLVGTARDAAAMVDGLLRGGLLTERSLEAMCRAHPVGGAIPGRPWTQCGYGLGLMAGRVGTAGRALGHSGCGPFSGNAVYHFPDLARPATVACFVAGPSEAPAEMAAVAIALREGGAPP